MQATPAFTYNGVQFSAPNSLGSARQVPQSDGAGGTAWGWIAAGDVTGLGSLATLSAAPAGTLTGTTLASNVVTSSLTAVGTIATGVWNGTAILPAYISTSTSGANIPLMNGTNTWTGPQTIQQNGLAVTADPGLTLINSTASTSGSGRQGAPGVIFSGTQWNGAASIVDAWKLVTLPSSGSTVSSFLFQRSTNGGAYSNMMTLTSAGALSITTVNATGAIQSGGNFESTVNQSASTSPYLHSGTVRTAGSGTDTFPIFFHQPTGTTAATTYSTGGTIFGANAASGFGGNFFDFRIAGSTSLGSLSSGGTLTTLALVANTLNTNGNITLASNQVLIWTSRGRITSPASDTIQFGNVDGASPTAQTLSVQSVIAGTSNTAGVLCTYRDSAGTGSANSGGWAWQTALANSGGGATVRNTFATRMGLNSAGQLSLIGTGSVNNILKLGGNNNGQISYESNALGQHFVILGDSTGSGGPMTMKMGSGALLFWQSTARSDGGSADTGIGRNSAGVVEINNGTAGTYRDLNARNGTYSGNLVASGNVVAGEAGLIGFSGRGTLTSDASNTLTASAAIATVDPTSGTGPAWKLGSVKAGAVALDAANYVEVMIGGVIKKLLVAA